MTKGPIAPALSSLFFFLPGRERLRVEPPAQRLQTNQSAAQQHERHTTVGNRLQMDVVESEVVASCKGVHIHGSESRTPCGDVEYRRELLPLTRCAGRSEVRPD